MSKPHGGRRIHFKMQFQRIILVKCHAGSQVHSNYFRLGVWSLHSLSAIIELLDLELWYAFSRKRRNRTTVPWLITIAIHIHCAYVKSSISTIRYALQVRCSSASIATMRRVLLTLPHDPISLGIHIRATHYECVLNPCRHLVTA